MQTSILIIAIITLFLLKDTISSEHRKFEAVLISIRILQAIIISLGHQNNLTPIEDQNGMNHLVSWMRYGALAFSGVIISTNYILHTDLLGPGFWSITDLLILFTLIGINSLQSLGLILPPSFALEIGLVYYTNKLYLPHLSTLFTKEAI